MTQWLMPEAECKADGTPRRVGIEIELSGIDVESLATLTADTLGGELERVSSAEFDVAVPDHGDYRVEVDFKLLKDLAREQESSLDENAIMNLGIEALGEASSLVVPCEIVSPPIPVHELAEPMDALVDALREAGARGTRRSFVYAFGVHLNIEPPDMQAETIAAYLQAFVCLYDWILDEGQVDLSRRMTPYIDPYPKDYDLLITGADYRPDWPSLISDYLSHNPTRDRAMDMLPMFASVDEERVRDATDDPLIKARPAFHYRLANSCVDEDGWSIAHPWNRWMQVERLAADRERLALVCAAFRTERQRILQKIDKRWVSKVKAWLDD